MDPIRVLIVEDDPMVMEINAQFVSRFSGFVLAGKAFSGKEAITLINQVNPNLVLLDYFLPDTNGLSLLQTIRNKHYPLDVILLTANRDPNHIQEIFRSGVVDYIVKPFRFDRFQSALEQYRSTLKRFKENRPFEQADLDGLKGAKHKSSVLEEHLPKGLNDRTLQQILQFLKGQAEPLSSEDVAIGTGLARVTVRRYLDYLEKKGEIVMEIQYGSVGRPMNKYRL
ncbi:response regulator [Neobacillus cucumis]|uniref:Two-component system response regulator n=1 Tax=Neobacillus cucumis TaxID=1740721 RepID=A0A2N5HBH5_9BACI|nr:response regulator [Neobacillus cucumis]PLS02865.1 two-component system response regulator [Neobacillus cucumis]